MKKSEIRLLVTEKIAKTENCEYLPSDITEEHLLRDDLGMDSLDFVELVMLCEKEFNIGIPDEAVEEKDNCSVGEFIEIVQSYTS